MVTGCAQAVLTVTQQPLALPASHPHMGPYLQQSWGQHQGCMAYAGPGTVHGGFPEVEL